MNHFQPCQTIISMCLQTSSNIIKQYQDGRTRSAILNYDSFTRTPGFSKSQFNIITCSPTRHNRMSIASSKEQRFNLRHSSNKYWNSSPSYASDYGHPKVEQIKGYINDIKKNPCLSYCVTFRNNSFMPPPAELGQYIIIL